MRRALIPAILAILVLPPSGFAHVTVTPTRAEPGADVLLTFVVPNEDRKVPIVGVLIRRAGGFEYEGFEAPPGWRLERRGRLIAWSGRRIEPGQFATFGITGSAPRARVLRFRVEEIYRDGRLPHYWPQVVVAPPASPAARDRGARTLGKAALFVAIAAAAVAVGAFFLALALWLRGGKTLQEGKRSPMVPSDE